MPRSSSPISRDTSSRTSVSASAPRSSALRSCVCQSARWSPHVCETECAHQRHCKRTECTYAIAQSAALLHAGAAGSLVLEGRSTPPRTTIAPALQERLAAAAARPPAVEREAHGQPVQMSKPNPNSKPMASLVKRPEPSPNPTPGGPHRVGQLHDLRAQLEHLVLQLRARVRPRARRGPARRRRRARARARRRTRCPRMLPSVGPRSRLRGAGHAGGGGGRLERCWGTCGVVRGLCRARVGLPGARCMPLGVRRRRGRGLGRLALLCDVGRDRPVASKQPRSRDGLWAGMRLTSKVMQRDWLPDRGGAARTNMEKPCMVPCTYRGVTDGLAQRQQHRTKCSGAFALCLHHRHATRQGTEHATRTWVRGSGGGAGLRANRGWRRLARHGARGGARA